MRVLATNDCENFMQFLNVGRMKIIEGILADSILGELSPLVPMTSSAQLLHFARQLACREAHRRNWSLKLEDRVYHALSIHLAMIAVEDRRGFHLAAAINGIWDEQRWFLGGGLTRDASCLVPLGFSCDADGPFCVAAWL